MNTPLEDLIGDLEMRIIGTVEELRDAEMDAYYATVLDLEERIERLYDTLAFVADRIATEGVASW